MNEPLTLISSVASGKSLLQKFATKSATPYRATAPTAPPHATARNRLILDSLRDSHYLRFKVGVISLEGRFWRTPSASVVEGSLPLPPESRPTPKRISPLPRRVRQLARGFAGSDGELPDSHGEFVDSPGDSPDPTGISRLPRRVGQLAPGFAECYRELPDSKRDLPAPTGSCRIPQGSCGITRQKRGGVRADWRLRVAGGQPAPEGGVERFGLERLRDRVVHAVVVCGLGAHGD